MKLNQRFSHGLQFLASYTFGKSLDYAGSPASGGGAVGGPQSVTLFDESRGPSGFDVKHRFVLSWVWALPFGEGHALAERRHPEADPRELAVQRHRHALDRPALHGLPQHRRQQRRAFVAGPDRRRPARRPDRRPVVRHRPPSRRRRPTPTATRAAASSTRRARRPWTCRCRAASRSSSRFRLQFRADAFNLFNTPQFGFPNANIGSPTAGRITTTIGRQPLDAVRAEAGLVTPPGESEGGGMPPSGRPQIRWLRSSVCLQRAIHRPRGQARVEEHERQAGRVRDRRGPLAGGEFSPGPRTASSSPSAS